MALTKNDVVKQVRKELGIQRNESIEITEAPTAAYLLRACRAQHQHCTERVNDAEKELIVPRNHLWPPIRFPKSGLLILDSNLLNPADLNIL